MLRNKSFAGGFADAVITLVLIVLSLITLYPFLYVFSMSISDPDAVMRQEVWFLPKGFSLKSYDLVFNNKKIWQAYGNTLWYTVVGTAINVFMTVIGAYALSRKEFFARNYIMIFISITLLFSGTLIPTFILINKLGLYNTRWALVIPGAVSAWYLIIARSYFDVSIPPSLTEAAKIDGCNDIGILTRIVLPLSMPIVAVLTIFYAVGHWNSWFNAVLYISDVNLQPLQLFLRKVLIMNSPDLMLGMEDSFERVAYALQLKYASIIVATLPIILVYPFVQKYFVNGVMIGAIKE